MTSLRFTIALYLAVAGAVAIQIIAAWPTGSYPAGPQFRAIGDQHNELPALLAEDRVSEWWVDRVTFDEIAHPYE